MAWEEYMVWSMVRAAILAAALWLGCGLAAAQQIEGLHGEATATIAAEIRSHGFSSPVRAYIFYGDLTGRGTNDAVALVYHPSGGNSDQITQWLFWDTGNGYRRAASSPLEDVFGIDPRNVRLSPGRVEITMTVMNPGDPRCCPTGEKTYVLALGEAAQAPSGSASGSGGWTATPVAGRGGVNIEAASADGRSRLTGACAAALGPGLWLTFVHDGDALERRLGDGELLLLEITGRNAVAYFTLSTRYERLGDEWVADRPQSGDFLDAFAAGDQLKVSGGDGGELARFGLRGTSRAVTTMREVCGTSVIVAATAPVTLPFVDGRYLSDASLCDLNDREITDRIGDDIHNVLLIIENGSVNGADFFCKVRDVKRDADLVRMNTACESEGTVNAVTMEMTYISERAFREGAQVFERCE